ncbi:glycyl-radical enzyme activating protein [Clostridium gasigenes]|uniref:glycyl-radical enzyme activating protein n=1 Tax=Clostridium gasigenes TaxID=94869 RepID=UPI001C0AA808|nr:glycyl-radical enzyme activating protein [Clostridium gasigenes]MBU3103951.1 glycyl-radical enzyme activating protein [Clostridium gasigenes]
MLGNDINYKEKGVVFNIQRFSVNDGPGIRTIVFLKGCPLSCTWCCNPESQSVYKQVMFNSENCNECGNCIKVCKRDAINFNNEYKIDKNKCTNCGECVDKCYSEALLMSGDDMTVEEVIKLIKKDSIHFRKSGGGVTLSGGEPLMQWKFASQLLKACKSMGWNTAIETTGFANNNILEEVIPLADLVLLDFKHIDNSKHIKFTGVSNETILNNAKTIVKLAEKVIARIPVIPDFNCDENSIQEIVEFVKSLKYIEEIHLLPYHVFGLNKYTCLGKSYSMPKSVMTPTDDVMEKFKNIVENYGVKCIIGGN